MDDRDRQFKHALEVCDIRCGCHIFVHWCCRRWRRMTQDVDEEHVAFHGGDVSGPVESYIPMTQLSSVSVGEFQRLVPSSRLQPFKVVTRDLR